MISILKKPGAWIPIALSLGMLAFILTYITVYGISTPSADGSCIGTCGRANADEGTPAHLFQIWLVLEFLMVGFFAAKWLPQRPMQALPVLALQTIAVLAGCAPVFILHL